MGSSSQRQQWIALLASLAAVGLVLGISGWRPTRAPAVAPLVAELYGAQAVGLLDGSARWDAWLLQPGPAREDGAFQGYAARGGPLSVRGDGFEGLLRLLRDPRSFGEPAEPCGATPLVGFRFSREGESLDLVLCFECDLLQSCREAGRVRRRFNRAALLPQVKRLWPRDPAVQALR